MNNKPLTKANRSQITHKDFSEREVKYAPLNVETVSDEGIFEGYASLFNTIDLTKDRVIKGAFAKGLKGKSPLNVKMLYQHNPNEPIGIWQVIKEDHKGLYVQGKLLKEITRAKEVLALMKQGALDGLSIGYKTIRSKRSNNSGVKQRNQPAQKTAIRDLIEVDLYEISIVTFPMHPDARVHSVKTLAMKNGLPTIREFERWLMRDAGFTRKQAQTAIAKGFKTLALTRDAESEKENKQKINQAVYSKLPLTDKLKQATKLFTNQ